MHPKLHIFIGSLFLLFYGLFSGNAFSSDCSNAVTSCTNAGWNNCTLGTSSYYPGPLAPGYTGSINTSGYMQNNPQVPNTWGFCTVVASDLTVSCPPAGTPYAGGYVPSSTAPTATVSALNPNDTSQSSYCGVTINPDKSSCPPNTVMPTFGTSTTTTPACIISGTYTGTTAPAGSASAVAPAGTSGSTCPAGTGSYSISNGTSTITGCAPTSKATTSNPNATPANTVTTGPNSTNTTVTNSTSSSTPNSSGGTDTTGSSATTNNAACGGVGQPACNVNSTCGGAGQPACNSDIGDSKFVGFTPTLTTPSFTDKTQGIVPTSDFAVGNYTSAGSSSCPLTDETGNVFGQSFTLPFSQICQYLDFVHYIVIIAAAIAAMKLL